MKASNDIDVLARVYLGISFFFSDHGNAWPNAVELQFLVMP